MHKLNWLLVITLVVTGACQQAQSVVCQLTPEKLLQQQRIAIQAIHLTSDTMDITSDAPLCWQPLDAGDSIRQLPAFYKQPRQAGIYGRKVSAWYFTDSTGNRLLTTDTTNLPFCTAILNKHLSNKPQGILKLQLFNNRIALVSGIKIGMHKRAFTDLIFKKLTTEESPCLLQQRVFVLSDAVGEYISSTYSFAGDTLRSITIQSPATYSSAQHQ